MRVPVRAQTAFGNDRETIAASAVAATASTVEGGGESRVRVLHRLRTWRGQFSVSKVCFRGRGCVVQTKGDALLIHARRESANDAKDT